MIKPIWFVTLSAIVSGCGGAPLRLAGDWEHSDDDGFRARYSLHRNGIAELHTWAADGATTSCELYWTVKGRRVQFRLPLPSTGEHGEIIEAEAIYDAQLVSGIGGRELVEGTARYHRVLEQ
jgi:hypothetical protein